MWADVQREGRKSHIDSGTPVLEAAHVTFNAHFKSQNKSNGHFRGVERVWFYSELEGAEQEEAAETTKESYQPAAPLGAWDVTEQNPALRELIIQ